MLANALDRQLIDVFERLLDVVGIENGQRTHVLDVFATQSENVGIGAHDYAKVASEA